MTSRERMCAVLNHEIPDRVPTFEYAIDKKVVERICPGGEYADVVEKLDLDGITAWEPSMGGYAKQLKKRKPGEIFLDEWGVKREWTHEMSAYPLEEDAPIRQESDLAGYRPPDPFAEDRFVELREYIRRFKGEKLVSFSVPDMFEITKCLMGIEEFLIACVQRTEFVKKAFDMATQWTIQVARKAVDLGADMIISGADVAYKTGPWIRPELMEEIHMPCLRRIVDAVKKRRAYVFNHTHGNIWSLLYMLVGTGVDVIHPFDPEGMMDIGIAKKVFGSKVVVAGNVSTDLLSRGTEEEVEKVTRETIDSAAGASGFILMASSSIHSAVKAQNYRRMVETCQSYGKYK
jgi:hypothetical protein